jgi:hypothetical protein
LLGWLSSRTVPTTNADGILYTIGGKNTMKKSVEALHKTKRELPYDPTIPLLGIYPKECKSGYNKDICTPMFIAALFTIAKLW